MKKMLLILILVPSLAFAADISKADYYDRAESLAGCVGDAIWVATAAHNKSERKTFKYIASNVMAPASAMCGVEATGRALPDSHTEGLITLRLEGLNQIKRASGHDEARKVAMNNLRRCSKILPEVK